MQNFVNIYLLISLLYFAAIVSIMKQASHGAFEKLATESQLIKSIGFGLSVIQGMLQSRQLFGSQGLNQWYPFNMVQMEQAVEILTGKLLRPGGQDPKTDKMTNMFAQVHYNYSIMKSSFFLCIFVG